MDTSETGLERLIVDWLREQNGYEQEGPHAYNRDYAMADGWTERFLRATQPERVEQTGCFASPVERRRFFAGLAKETARRGVTDVLRNGCKYRGETFRLYYPLPSELSADGKAKYGENIFGVIRQVMYSKANQNEIDFVVFVNGLPLATFELKNRLTGQTYEDAIRQYKADRDPGEALLQKKRCAVHFALDDRQVWMCTALAGKDSWFLPFNKGVDGGAGNPPAEGDVMTAYLWKEVFAKPSLSNIIENFAQVTITEDRQTHRKREAVIWPRYHQLDAVRTLTEVTRQSPIGRRFLIQHSAGSGKSNTLTWLAFRLVTLLRDGRQPFFDSVIVVTDRVNLDRQIRDNIRAFQREESLVGWADRSASLRELLQGGKKIVVSTIYKFGFILDEIGGTLRDRRFAIIIDEAHSSQSGTLSADLATVVSGHAAPVAAGWKGDTLPMAAEEVVAPFAEEEVEDKICRIIKGRRMAENANYYAFTATPKNKTLEMFGDRIDRINAEGENVPLFLPFHEYTMKQAIEEGFILDVLRHYTPYSSYYRVLKAVEEDPKYDRKKALGRMRSYVERQPATVGKKAEIIVEHFCVHVCGKIGGQARAMVVTSSIERAIDFYREISRLLVERGSPYRAIVAFTDKVIGGKVVTEGELNGFPSAEIEARIVQEPYRILVVADKFQTGYDQPLLHTMYVDKALCDLKAVQTLSRLNRCHPKKHDTFVLDFVNEAETIRQSFQCYYKATLLEGESDPGRLDELAATVEGFRLYTADEKESVVRLKLAGGDDDRPRIDGILDAVAARFEEMGEAEQIACKSAMKNFCRCYPYFASIVPFESPQWERQYVFYSLLVRKLPKLRIDDDTEGLLEEIGFDDYLVRKGEEQPIELEDRDSAVEPVPAGTGGGKPEPDMAELSAIVEEFNSRFGSIDWSGFSGGKEGAAKRIAEDLPQRIARQEEFANVVRNGGDSDTARRISYSSVEDILTDFAEEDVVFMTTYFKNSDFKAFVNKAVFQNAVGLLQRSSAGGGAARP